MTKKISDLLNEYEMKLDEEFPLKFVNLDDYELIKTLEHCIQTKTPYHLPTTDTVEEMEQYYQAKAENNKIEFSW